MLHFQYLPIVENFRQPDSNFTIPPQSKLKPNANFLKGHGLPTACDQQTYSSNITTRKEEDSQCGNYVYLLSQIIDKNVVKVTFLPRKLLKVDFTKYFFRERKFLVFPHCGG